MAENGNGSNVTKLESRWIAFITAIALLFGGWWLQNQYDTVLRLQQQQTDFMRHVDDKYVQKDYLETVTSRLERIEDKIDDLRDTDQRRVPTSVGR
jgi:cell division protein FtsB